MSEFLASNKIHVFPTANRATNTSLDSEAFLMTETNLTRMMSATSYSNNFVREDGNDLIIYIKGYFFKCALNDIKALFSEESDKADIWACIKVNLDGASEIGGSVGSGEFNNLVQANTSQQVNRTLDDSGEFKGIRFIMRSSSPVGYDSDCVLKILEFSNNDWHVSDSARLILSSNQISNGSLSIPITEEFNIDELTVNGQSTFNDNVQINRDLTVEDNLIVDNGSIWVNDDSHFEGSVKINENLTVDGNIIPWLTNTSSLGNSTKYFKDIYVNNIHYNKNLFHIPTYYIGTGSGAECYYVNSPNSDYSIQIGDLGFTVDKGETGDSHSENILNVYYDSKNIVKVSGDLKVTSNSTILGNESIGGNLSVTGNTTVSGNETVDKNLTVGYETGGQGQSHSITLKSGDLNNSHSIKFKTDYINNPKISILDSDNLQLEYTNGFEGSVTKTETLCGVYMNEPAGVGSTASEKFNNLKTILRSNKLLNLYFVNKDSSTNKVRYKTKVCWRILENSIDNRIYIGYLQMVIGSAYAPYVPQFSNQYIQITEYGISGSEDDIGWDNLYYDSVGKINLE